MGDPTTEPILELFKVQWRMPHVLLSEINKLAMLCFLESGQYLSMNFRSWNRVSDQSITKHLWAIKTVIQFQKLRYVILCNANKSKNVRGYKSIQWLQINHAKLYLNSKCYPYDDLNLDFEKQMCDSVQLVWYARFCKSYYGYEYLEPSLIFTTFLHNGLFVIIALDRISQEWYRGRAIRLWM